MGDPPRCVVCAQDRDLHEHHVAGRAHLPAATVLICPTSHAACHRGVAAAGVSLRSSGASSERERLRAIAVGFTVILEYASALEHDPAAARTRLRARLEAMLTLIDAALPDDRVDRGCSLPARSFSPQPGDRPSDCRARAPRDELERSRRSAAMLSGLLPCLAELLAAILPAELAPLDLPGRLGNIDPHRLSEACREGRLGEAPDVSVSASLSDLGATLDALVSHLEQSAL